MMRRVWLAAGLMAGLGACASTEVADSAATGVGFGDYETYLAERQARAAQLSGAAPSAPEASGAPAATPAPVAGITAADLAAAGIGVTNTAGRAPAPASPAPAPASAAPMATVAGTAGTPAGGRSGAPAAPVIERAGGPAAAAAPANPQGGAPAPGAAPVAAAPAPQAVGTDIVAYALATRHGVGQQLYRRTFASPARSARACNRYAGADLAQRAFLEAGGPERDRLGLDPDGDGFACGWDPAPFRAARG